MDRPHRQEPDTVTHREDDHDHHHDHDHATDDVDPSDPEARARALQSLLVEKGLVTTDDIDAVVAKYEHDIGPLTGARVVARAWTDPAFKERLLDDAMAAVRELDIEVGLDHLAVVENTDHVHNVVVCTLCSCYPWSMLGLPPTWYKSEAYRSRVVKEPRAVLAEFGLDLPDDVEVNVWDSSSEVRYMVLPQRPPGTEDWSEDDLVDLVERDDMIGVSKPAAPVEA